MGPRPASWATESDETGRSAAITINWILISTMLVPIQVIRVPLSKYTKARRLYTLERQLCSKKDYVMPTFELAIEMRPNPTLEKRLTIARGTREAVFNA